MKTFLQSNQTFFKHITIYLFLFTSIVSCRLTQGDKESLEFGSNADSLKKISEVLSAPDLAHLMYLEAKSGHAYIENGGLTFELIPKQKKVFNGIRSELTINYPYKTGEKVLYSFDMLVPEAFKADEGKNRWWIFAQWHDQPDPSSKQSWSNFPANSPPVSLFMEKRMGKFGLGIDYFGQEKFWFPIDKGKWNNYSFKITWNIDEKGELLFSLDHEVMHIFTGKNMLNNYHHYLKIGMYRHPNIALLSQVSFRNLKIEANN